MKDAVKSRRRIEAARRHLPTLAWTLLVAALLLAPGDRLPDFASSDWLDKPVHAGLFAVQTALLVRSWRRLLPAGLDLAAAAAMAAGLAGALELAQRWVPGRSPEPWDLVANLAGILLALLVNAHRRARVRSPGEARR